MWWTWLAEANGLRHCFNTKTQAASTHWYRHFMKRHPELSLRQAEATSIAKAKGFNRESVYEFYDKLKKLIETYGFHATNNFNMNESGITTVQKPGRVLEKRGKKQVGSLTSGERGFTTTVVRSMSAGGNCVPPMIVFRRKRMIESLEDGAPPGSVIVNNESGWMNKELFVVWLKHVVSHVGCTKDRPVLLILDGHSSHTKNIEAIQYARDHGVVIFSLPPHTTHRLQPLHRVFYKSLMTYYNPECDSWLRTETTTVTIS